MSELLILKTPKLITTSTHSNHQKTCRLVAEKGATDRQLEQGKRQPFAVRKVQLMYTPHRNRRRKMKRLFLYPEIATKKARKGFRALKSYKGKLNVLRPFVYLKVFA